MKVFKTMVASEEGILEMDTVEYEGKLWLVLDWTADYDKGIEWPALLIGLPGVGMPLQRLHQGHPADYSLPIQLSKDTLRRGTTQGFRVVEDLEKIRNAGLIRSVGTTSKT